MSYILDSLKKSDRQRKQDSSDNELLPQDVPYDESKKLSLPLWSLFWVLLIALLLWVIFLWERELSNESLPDAHEVEMIDQKPVLEAVDSHKQEPEMLQPQVVEQISEDIIIEEELNNSHIQSLYNQPNKIDTTKQLNQKIVDLYQIEEPLVAESNSNNNNSSEEVKQEKRLIPLIYELEPSARQRIPSIDYGAHVYSSDHNKGFVILNGAKRNIGEQMDNGVVVEKVLEDELILSFEGVIFAVPAMKSWKRKAVE